MWKKKGKHNFRVHYAILPVSGNNSPIVSVLTVSISSGVLVLSILYLRKLRKLKYIQRIAIRMIRNVTMFWEEWLWLLRQLCRKNDIILLFKYLKRYGSEGDQVLSSISQKVRHRIINLSYRKVESDWMLGTKS